MERLFADTNIFGIAVDRDDGRRNSVWKIFERVACGEIELHTTQIVVEEIKQNPHKPTREKELDLVRNLTTEIHDLDKKNFAFGKIFVPNQKVYFLIRARKQRTWLTN